MTPLTTSIACSFIHAHLNTYGLVYINITHDSHRIVAGDYTLFALTPENLAVSRWRIESRDGRSVAQCKTLKEGIYKLIGAIVRDHTLAALNHHLEVVCGTSNPKVQELLNWQSSEGIR